MTTVYDHSAKTIDGKEVPLSAFRGKALLIVNTASEYGFTPQYAGLEALHKKFAGDGFSVLGFPCNQFGAQEPGAEDQIAAFCEVNYGVTFPMFAKIEVNGPNAHKLFKHLTSAKAGVLGTEAIKWNFTKFLVDRSGKVIKRFAPADSPEKIDKHVGDVLGEPARS